MSDAKVRIFVSSPSDVDHERALLKEVCGRLREEYLSYFEVQAILWEEEALTADRNFQDGILRPSDCEIVVVVLWTRLGTPLPDEPYGGMTGTQWEFVNAVEASSGHGHPEVLVYKKNTPRFVDITNAEATREALEDRRRLEEFFRANFFNPDESFRRAFRTFDSDAGFRDLVEGQLRKLLNRRISTEKRAAAGAAEWRGSPYRPDGPYAQADARIFTGREAETRDLLARLPARSFLLLSGASGCGKTSLIRAGLLSRLERPFLLEGVAGCRIALVDPSPGAGPTTDPPTGPLAALAAGLCTPQALGPTLAGFGVTAEGLAQLLARDPGAAAAQVGAALTALAQERKGHTGMAEGELRLALVLDPLDALLAACAERGPDACAGLVAAAAALASGGRTWVIGVVGTARLGHLAPLLPLLAVSDSDGVPGLDPDAWYHLEAPAPGRVRQVVEIPARVAGVEVEDHAPGDRRSLVDLLEAEAGSLRHWPPLVEAALDLAYRRAAERARTQPQGRRRRDPDPGRLPGRGRYRRGRARQGRGRLGRARRRGALGPARALPGPHQPGWGPPRPALRGPPGAGGGPRLPRPGRGPGGGASGGRGRRARPPDRQPMPPGRLQPVGGGARDPASDLGGVARQAEAEAGRRSADGRAGARTGRRSDRCGGRARSGPERVSRRG